MRNIFYEEGIANHSRNRKIKPASNFKDSRISIKSEKKICFSVKKILGCSNEQNFNLKKIKKERKKKKRGGGIV